MHNNLLDKFVSRVNICLHLVSALPTTPQLPPTRHTPLMKPKWRQPQPGKSNMRQPTLLAIAALLTIAVAACEDTTTPPPIGSIEGSVTIEGAPISGVVVTLSNGSVVTTSQTGTYRFATVQGGVYTLTISNFPNDAIFDRTVRTAIIAVEGQLFTLDFSGKYIRTSAILGRVSVEGNSVSGATIQLRGTSEATATTNLNGEYRFPELRKGNYTVEVSGYDTNEISFTNTIQSVSLGLGESRLANFLGSYQNNGSILGEVAVGDTLLSGITVRLTGEGNRSTRTNSAGQYSFTDLHAGNYQVTISGFDQAKYIFDPTVKSVSLRRNETRPVNFHGRPVPPKPLRSIGGQLFIDEFVKNGIFDAGEEDRIEVAGVSIVLNGPDVGNQRITATNSKGEFTFASLTPGTYRVVFNPQQDSTIEAGALKGLRHSGPATGTVLELDGDSARVVNIPFEITHQTIVLTATVKDTTKKVNPPLEKATFSIHATLDQARNGSSPLDTDTTDSTGTATFYYPRAADNDKVVFAVLDTLISDSLSVPTTNYFDISYGAKDRSITAALVFEVEKINTIPSLKIRVKNIKTAIGGDQGLAGWRPEIVTDTVNPKPISGVPATDSNGNTVYTPTQDEDSLPITFYISLADSQAVANGESWQLTAEPTANADSISVGTGSAKKQYITYVYDGTTTSSPVELGVFRTKFTTQSLTVAAHYERDHIAGLTTGGDSPLGADLTGRQAEAAKAGQVTLRYRNAAGNDQIFTSSDTTHDINKNGNPRRFSDSTGTLTFKNLPTDQRFFVTFAPASGYQAINSVQVHTWENYAEHTEGAFGNDGGTGPNVKLCPQSTTGTTCSTFAFIKTDNTVTAVVRTKLDSALAARVELTPAASYNLSGSTAITRTLTTTSGMDTATFENVPGGLYTLRATPTDTGWQIKSSPTTLRLTSGYNERTKFVGDPLTSISGTVANDRIDPDDDEVTAEETHSGLKMVLYQVTGSGSSRSETAVDTATTNTSGAYSFPFLPDGTYVVRTSDTAEVIVYSGRRDSNGNLVLASPDLTTSVDPITGAATNVDSGDLLPHWEYDLSRVNSRDGYKDGSDELDTSRGSGKPDADFIVLYKNASLAGKVLPWEFVDTAKITISAKLCRIPATTTATCARNSYEDSVEINLPPTGSGEWQIPNLREGYYEIELRIDSVADFQFVDDSTRLVFLKGKAATDSANFTVDIP